MLWRGVEIEPQWVALALALIAVTLGRGRQFLFDFAPFLLLFFAYEVMRGFAAKTGFAPHDLSGLERLVFAGTLPSVVLQHAFYRADSIAILDWVTIGFYFTHFILPVAVGFFFWLRSRDHYWRYASALLVLSFLAFVTYLFYPSAPPWYQFGPPQYQGPDLIVKISDATVTKWGVHYVVSPIYGSLNPNRFAAFPSLHAAYPALAAIYAWNRYRPVSLFLLAWAGCVWFSIVYLGEHYVVDALDGLLYIAAAVLTVEAVAGRWRRRPARSKPRAEPAQPAATPPRPSS